MAFQSDLPARESMGAQLGSATGTLDGIMTSMTDIMNSMNNINSKLRPCPLFPTRSQPQQPSSSPLPCTDSRPASAHV